MSIAPVIVVMRRQPCPIRCRVATCAACTESTSTYGRPPTPGSPMNTTGWVSREVARARSVPWCETITAPSMRPLVR